MDSTHSPDDARRRRRSDLSFGRLGWALVLGAIALEAVPAVVAVIAR